jgi:hypothetical protein
MPAELLDLIASAEDRADRARARKTHTGDSQPEALRFLSRVVLFSYVSAGSAAFARTAATPRIRATSRGATDPHGKRVTNLGKSENFRPVSDGDFHGFRALYVAPFSHSAVAKDRQEAQDFFLIRPRIPASGGSLTNGHVDRLRNDQPADREHDVLPDPAQRIPQTRRPLDRDGVERATNGYAGR